MPWGHLPKLCYLQIPVVDRNLFKGFKYPTSLEVLRTRKFEQELLRVSDDDEVEEEDGMVYRSLQKLQWMTLGSRQRSSKATSCHLPKGVQYLTSLQELTIINCKELYLSWGVLLSLDHLRILRIEHVEKVIDVGSDVLVQRQLRALQELNFDGSSAELVHDIPWTSFPSLRSMRLSCISNLQVLPEGIQHLTALQYLEIMMHESLVSLPYWMSRLSSLHTLHLLCLSEELKEQCQRLTGEDCSRIQHIPKIKIDLREDILLQLRLCSNKDFP